MRWALAVASFVILGVVLNALIFGFAHMGWWGIVALIICFAAWMKFVYEP